MKDSPNEESHFEITVVADQFNGLQVIKRHQLMHELLKTEFEQVHSISMKLLPSETK